MPNGLWVLSTVTENRSVATCLSVAPTTQSLLASFLFQNIVNRSKHLESHIKAITQLGKPIDINYPKNLPDGKTFPHWMVQSL